MHGHVHGHAHTHVHTHVYRHAHRHVGSTCIDACIDMGTRSVLSPRMHAHCESIWYSFGIFKNRSLRGFLTSRSSTVGTLTSASPTRHRHATTRLAHARTHAHTRACTPRISVLDGPDVLTARSERVMVVGLSQMVWMLVQLECSSRRSRMFPAGVLHVW